MTDAIAALTHLCRHSGEATEQALEQFYQRWHADPLVVEKWLSVQAASTSDETPERVGRLLMHPAFDLKNPNKVRSLLGVFARNLRHFHAAGGEGYRLIGDYVLKLDPLNPQVAARLMGAFSRWKRLDETRQAHAQRVLDRIVSEYGLSRDVSEIAHKTLGG